MSTFKKMCLQIQQYRNRLTDERIENHNLKEEIKKLRKELEEYKKEIK